MTNPTTSPLTNTTKTPWHLTPRWLRALAVEADIWGRPDVTALVTLARCGNQTALKACERHWAKIKA